MRTPDGDNILAIIRARTGKDNAIGAREISRALGWPESEERQVRRIIADEAHLWPGVLVCATSSYGGGYFVAESYDEAEAYHNWLTDLAAVANRKVFNFREACSKIGIRFAQQKAA